MVFLPIITSLFLPNISARTQTKPYVFLQSSSIQLFLAHNPFLQQFHILTAYLHIACLHVLLTACLTISTCLYLSLPVSVSICLSAIFLPAFLPAPVCLPSYLPLPVSVCLCQFLPVYYLPALFCLSDLIRALLQFLPVYLSVSLTPPAPPPSPSPLPPILSLLLSYFSLFSCLFTVSRRGEISDKFSPLLSRCPDF